MVKLEELDGSQGGYYEFRKCTKGMKTTLSQIPVGGVVLFSEIFPLGRRHQNSSRDYRSTARHRCLSL